MFEGPQSGKFAIIHEEGLPITHMFNWNLDISHTPETYYASNTRWGADRNPGVIDWTGNFSVFDGKKTLDAWRVFQVCRILYSTNIWCAWEM